jgi:hypothetical protein
MVSFQREDYSLLPFLCKVSDLTSIRQTIEMSAAGKLPELYRSEITQLNY